MDQSFFMTIGSDIENIPAVSTRLEGAMKSYGFCTDEILDTQLAVEEAITNVIVHGYKKTGGEIHLSCRVTPDLVRIRISDTAPPFNPLSIPEPERAGNIDQRRIGGLGIFLLRHVMDTISYQHENGKNILILEKRRLS
jgi:serine/threonine-protein kinase RsbW